MKAVLFIIVPMVVLTVVMTFVFRASSDPEERRPGTTAGPNSVFADQAPAARAKASPEKKTESAKPVPSSAESKKPLPAPEPTTRNADSPGEKRVADAVDDWAAVNRTRKRKDRPTQLALAKRALASSKPAEAIAASDRILSAHPNDADALSIRAAALVQAERYQEAESVYQQVMKLRPDDIHLRYNYAVTLTRMGRFGEAIRAYESVLKHRPNHARAMYNLASLYQDEGKLTDSARLWGRVCKANPELVSAWFSRGVVALQLNDFETAVKALTRADELQPGQVDTQTNLGVAYHESGHLPEAIKAFQAARKTNPDYLPAINGIAEVYLRYFKKDPNSEEHLECGLRWCEYSQSLRAHQPRLRALYQQALKMRPDNLSAMNGLAHVLAETPRFDPRYQATRLQAIELCRKSLDAQPNQPKLKKLLAKLESRATP